MHQLPTTFYTEYPGVLLEKRSLRFPLKQGVASRNPESAHAAPLARGGAPLRESMITSRRVALSCRDCWGFQHDENLDVYGPSSCYQVKAGLSSLTFERQIIHMLLLHSV